MRVGLLPDRRGQRFRLDPSQQSPRLHSGNGGFALVAQSDQPIYQDLNSPEGRRQLGFSADRERLLARCKLFRCG